jgi:syntaxin 16
MTTRDLFPKFSTFRDQAKRVRGGRPPTLGFKKIGDQLLDPEQKDVRINVPDGHQPEWVDIASNIEKYLNAVDTKIKTLQQKHVERLKVTFVDEDDRLEEDIDITTKSITELLKKGEMGLKRIALVGTENGLTVEEKTIRLNVMRHLGTQLQTQSKNFKQVQRKFLSDLDRQQQVGKHFFDEGESKVPLSDIDGGEGGLSHSEQMKLEELKEIGDARHKEIIKIAESIHELAQLFNELNVLVIEQGTILDRIDYNIEMALEKVKGGTGELVEAEKISKKARSLKCILCLMLVVIIMLTILILKHSTGSSSSSSSNP